MATLLAVLLATSPGLEEGRAHFASMRYQAAVSKLEAVANDARAPLAERVEANDLLARAHLALGRTAKTIAAYEALLGLDPMWETPKAAPKVVAAFERAKQNVFRPDFVTLERVSRTPEVIEVRVVNPWRLRLTLQLQESVGGPFTSREVPLEPTGVGLARLTPGARYYLRATAEGRVLAELGSEADAFAAAPAPAAAQLPADAPRASSPLVAPVVRSEGAPVSAPSATEWNIKRTAGWGLVIVGAVLSLAGVGVGGWGITDVNRAGSPTSGLTADQAKTMREDGESRLWYGGGGLAVGLLVVAVGSFLVATAGQ